MDLEHERRLAAVEQRAKSNTHRINELEPVVKEIHKMSETMVEMTVEMKHVNENVGEIKGKVESIEREPAKNWSDAKKAFFNALLGALGTAVAGGVIYLLTTV